MSRSKNYIPNNGQLHMNINPNTLPDVECSCGHKIFMQGLLVKYLSAIQSPSGKAGLVNIAVFYCTKCGRAYTPEAMLESIEKMKSIDNAVKNIESN